MIHGTCLGSLHSIVGLVAAVAVSTAFITAGGDAAAQTTPAITADGSPSVAPLPTTPAAHSDQPVAGWGAITRIVFSGGLTGSFIVLLLVALSIAATALCVEHLMTIRLPVLVPPGVSDLIRKSLAQADLSEAEQTCQAHPSFLSYVVRAGLVEADSGWTAVEKGMEDATAEQAARLLRKIEYLSVIGNIAPMIGLLGTVVGMIFAFQEVAESQGAARAADLAAGIYQALVTTVGGLVVAIPSLAAFAVFRNRVDQLVADTVYHVGHATLPLKQALRPKRSSPRSAAPNPPLPPSRSRP